MMDDKDIDNIVVMMMGRKIPVIDMGIISYDTGFRLQTLLAEKILENSLKGVILLLEHTPVITIGNNRSRINLLASERQLQESSIELVSSNRGGDITLHAPGQLVCYPVLDLRYFKSDLSIFVHNLEQVLLDALRSFGISGRRIEKHRGIFIENYKIASIGLRVRKWISIHGFSLNVNIDLSYFQYIVACGLKDFPQVSMSSILEKNIAIDDVKEQIIKGFESVFNISTAVKVLK